MPFCLTLWGFFNIMNSSVLRKKFEKGIPNGGLNIYGYRWKNKKLEVVPEEAEVVKNIYDN